MWRRAAPFLDAIARTRPRSRDINAAVAVADLRLYPEERWASGRRRLPRRRETDMTAVRHRDSGAAGCEDHELLLAPCLPTTAPHVGEAPVVRPLQPSAVRQSDPEVGRRSARRVDEQKMVSVGAQRVAHDRLLPDREPSSVR